MSTPSPVISLAGSSDSRARHRRRKRMRQTGPSASETSPREAGIALIIAMTAIAILAVMLADMHESTTTAYMVATTERDSLRAEYAARSGLNLTRLLISQEPAIRALVAPIYQMMIGRPPPMIPIWMYADSILRPFCLARSRRHGAESARANAGSIELATA